MLARFDPSCVMVKFSKQVPEPPRTGPSSSTANFNFEVLILAAPEGQTCHPVFSIDQLLCSRPLLARKDASHTLEIRAGYGTAHRAWCNHNFRVVANSPVLPGIVAGHDVELAVTFGEPKRGSHGRPALAERRQRDVFLAGNFPWDRHRVIVPANQHAAFQRLRFQATWLWCSLQSKVFP